MAQQPPQKKEIMSVPVSDEMKLYLSVIAQGDMKKIDRWAKAMSTDWNFFPKGTNGQKGELKHDAVLLEMMKEMRARDVLMYAAIQSLESQLREFQNTPLPQATVTPDQQLVPVYDGSHHAGVETLIITPTPSSDHPVKTVDTSSDGKIAEVVQDDEYRDDVPKITPRKVTNEKSAQATSRQNTTKTLPATPSRSTVTPTVVPVYTGGSHPADWTTSDDELDLQKKIIAASSNKHSYSTLRGLRKEHMINILKSLGGKMVSS